MKAVNLGNRVVKFYPDLIRYCKWLCRTPEDAEDLCHNTIAKVLTSQFSDEKGNNLKSYLFKSATRLRMNYQKSSYYNKLVCVEQLEAGEVQIGCQYDFDIIESSINKLNPKSNEVMHMLIKGYEYSEIAEHMNINIGTVKSIIHNSRNKLRKVYGQDLN